jgi:N-acetyl-anhydromuramyl-L-alanine amidase AmpD
VVQAPGTPGFSAPGPAPNSEKPRFRPPDVPEAWIPTAPPNAWRWIIIHHSATPAGNAAVFDRTHRRKGWDELAYHFVIGNGTGSGDGQIEVGSRWPKQKWGAHAKTPDNQFNDFGIGICLVGNFDIDRPTSAQLRSLTKLLAYLTKTYHIPPGRLLGHGEIKPTDCPGRNMNIAEVRRTVAALAQAPPGPDVTMAHAPDRRLLKSAPSP